MYLIETYNYKEIFYSLLNLTTYNKKSFGSKSENSGDKMMVVPIVKKISSLKSVHKCGFRFQDS